MYLPVRIEAHENIIVHEISERQIPKYACNRIARRTHQDGADRSNGELFDGPMLHARVDGNNGDVTLITEADVRNNEKDIGPRTRLGFDITGNEATLIERTKNVFFS